MGWPEWTYLTYVVTATTLYVGWAIRRRMWRAVVLRSATVALCLTLLTLGGFWK